MIGGLFKGLFSALQVLPLLYPKAWKVGDRLVNIKEKIIAIIGAIVLIWLLSPVPEISIIFGLLGWKVLPFSWPYRILGIVVGLIIGFYLTRRFNLDKKIKEKFGITRESDD